MLENAQVDSLTGFHTRESLDSFLGNLIQESNSTKKPFSIAIVDLDHFKKFNDKYGHLFGDEILKYATSTLRLTIYEAQCVFFRYGGDEFIGIFPHREPKDAYPLIRQCQHNLRHRPFLYENKFYRLTISCGISGYPYDGKNVEELLGKADEALYFSKRSGRNFTAIAGRIQYLKWRKIVLTVGIFALILIAGFIVYRVTYKKVIHAVSQIRGIKLVTKPEDLDSIILKNGLTFEGRILAESEDRVVLNLYFEKGEGKMTFERSEIAQIKYGSKSLPPKTK